MPISHALLAAAGSGCRLTNLVAVRNARKNWQHFCLQDMSPQHAGTATARCDMRKHAHHAPSRAVSTVDVQDHTSGVCELAHRRSSGMLALPSSSKAAILPASAAQLMHLFLLATVFACRAAAVPS
jgi:hypothetical protein